MSDVCPDQSTVSDDLNYGQGRPKEQLASQQQLGGFFALGIVILMIILGAILTYPTAILSLFGQ